MNGYDLSLKGSGLFGYRVAFHIGIELALSSSGPTVGGTVCSDQRAACGDSRV